ncbi:MAG: 1-(5-phosphoribosyl)-5-[(5-phosphoribosylamino)methylideneamino]imidazole-4-carboxamide isomerase [Bacteroidales bacterium]
MIEIIPAIDIIEGKCVRLEKGDFSKKTQYKVTPVEIARQFEDDGAETIHIVDLDGAKNESMQNLQKLEEIRKNTNLTIDFSGGIRSKKQINRLFNAGANYLTIGSMAVNDFEKFREILKELGPARFILAADTQKGRLVSQGWKKTNNIDVIDFINRFRALGIANVMSTDVTRDGMLMGTEIAYYQNLKNHFPGMNIIASGGVSSVDDIAELNKAGISGVIIGKALYEGKLHLKETIEVLNDKLNNPGNNK